MGTLSVVSALPGLHDNLKAAIHIYEKSGYTEIERPPEVNHGAMNRFFRKELV